MATIKLMDELGTRYIINSLTGALTTVLQSAAKNGDTVDLCGCKLGPDAALTIKPFYSTINFINTEDSYLDGVLKNNCIRSREEPEEYESLDLQNIRSIEVYMNLAKDLPQGAKLKPVVSLSKLIDKVTLILLIMTRPDIEFDIRQCASDVYDYVRDAWLSSALHHDKYYELIPPDTVLRLPDENGYFGCVGYGFQRETSFIRNRQVLPWEFGNTKIIELGRGSVDEEWRPVVEKCLDAFETSYAERKTGKVLRNLLTFREE